MREYKVGDLLNIAPKYEDQAAVVVADFAWARPQRNGVYVTYPTIEFEELKDHIDTSMEMLKPGGWAFFDADDWLLPRLITHLQSEWGDVAKTYTGGGYRRTGTVVYDGHPGGGHYFTNGGYHVVFAHKGETDRTSSTSSKQVAERPKNTPNWGTPKPIDPYRKWVTEVLKDPKETTIIPHAGTAPAAIGLEMEYGDNATYICIDVELEAKEAFETRRKRELETQANIDNY